MQGSQSMGSGEYVHGWDTTDTTWLPHRAWGRPKQTEVIITAEDWPGVEWPMHHPGGDDTWTGEGKLQGVMYAHVCAPACDGF